jgi:hypothetical protein
MSTRRIATIAVISALLGLVVGAFAAYQYLLDFNAQFMSSGLVLKTQADLVTRVSVLEHLRAGRSEDAAKLLEALLDGDLISAGALARDGHKFSANTHRAVGLELRARKISGYQPADPNVREAVQEAFRLLPQGIGGTAAQPGAVGGGH